MRRIRASLLTAILALFLALPLASVASADPGDGGVPSDARADTDSRTAGWTWTADAAVDPGDGGVPGQ